MTGKLIGVPYNPKGKVSSRVGLCQCPDHGDYSENPKRGQDVSLWMLYSNEWNDFMDTNHDNMSTNDLDVMWEEMEKTQYVAGSEVYYCEDCRDGTND